MKKVLSILICIVCLAGLQSHAQTITNTDLLKIKAEEKRIADSTELSLRQIAFKKRQDSIAEIMKQRQEDRVERMDSIRKARLEQRQNELQQKRDYINRKKERAQIRDSVARESKKAAAARKAYLKSLKNKKPEENKKETIKKEVVKKEKKKKEEAPKKEPEKKKDKKGITQEKNNDKKQEAEKLAQQKKQEADSIAAAKREAENNNKQIEKSTPIITTKRDVQLGGFNKNGRFLERPEAKKTFFSFQIGASNCLTDLGGNSRVENNLFDDVNFRDNTFFYGFSLSHLRREAIGLRVNYVFGTIGASDKNTFFTAEADPSYNRYVRNLDFQSKINEGSLMLEVHPFKFLNYKSALHQSYLQPYFLVGIGTYSFNPQGSYYDPILDEDVWVDLQPLGTEGQGSSQFPNRTPYKLSQWNIPYGVGFNYEISRTINLGLELVARKLFTDYLDDVSTSYVDPIIFDQRLTPENAELAKILNNKSKLVDAGREFGVGDMRGNPGANDMYFSISGRISIKLNKNKKTEAQTKRGFYRYDDNEICE